MALKRQLPSLLVIEAGDCGGFPVCPPNNGEDCQHSMEIDPSGAVSGQFGAMRRPILVMMGPTGADLRTKRARPCYPSANKADALVLHPCNSTNSKPKGVRPTLPQNPQNEMSPPPAEQSPASAYLLHTASVGRSVGRLVGRATCGEYPRGPPLPPVQSVLGRHTHINSGPRNTATGPTPPQQGVAGQGQTAEGWANAPCKTGHARAHTHTCVCTSGAKALSCRNRQPCQLPSPVHSMFSRNLWLKHL
jgi:hypothetical protein|uniref:Uncharacterized protein n=1 Tax=Eutreptiella gymnastica TaxID=73025 RepID=A0A7S4G709_9EUGL|mmetsp:Transcript_109858/g.186906  ORF Transcript_109858/g.186906 Transcript_109858/m.186906 type:complete len:248 (+) Transcript_109858:164-907(+)